METKVEAIANRAREHPDEKFTALMHHFSEENLRDCYQSLEGRKAAGVDGVTKEEYGKNLDNNLKGLVGRMKQMSYRPQAVRRVEIPKSDGSRRLLGISCTEDKIVQEMARRILEALYEPIFTEKSYGFRPGRSCHEALRCLNQELMEKPVNWIVDLDLRQFFDTIPHQKMLEVLSVKVADKRFLRLIARMLKGGIQGQAEVIYVDEGSPQGSIVSPILANIYLDTVLDKWVTETLKPYFQGYIEEIRYADDTLVLFEKEEEAQRFMKVLPLRLAKFGLSLNEGKTKLVSFGKEAAHKAKAEGNRLPTIDFLGFTHYWGKSRKGKLRVKRKTARKRFSRSVKSINEWLRRERNRRPLKELWPELRVRMLGHYNYYGVTDNAPGLQRFYYEVKKSLFKWLNRRSQKASFNWENFGRYIELFPLPKPRIRVNLIPTW